jgi:hypothetical protein
VAVLVVVRVEQAQELLAEEQQHLDKVMLVALQLVAVEIQPQEVVVRVLWVAMLLVQLVEMVA